MFELTVDSHFSAAHYLREYQGDCARMHGHNWNVSLTVAAQNVEGIGICMDFKDIATVLDSVLERYDHQTLNKIDPFQTINPTAENLAQIIFKMCRDKLNTTGVTVKSVTVAESDRYRVTFSQ